MEPSIILIVGQLAFFSIALPDDQILADDMLSHFEQWMEQNDLDEVVLQGAETQRLISCVFPQAILN